MTFRSLEPECYHTGSEVSAWLVNSAGGWSKFRRTEGFKQNVTVFYPACSIRFTGSGPVRQVATLNPQSLLKKNLITFKQQAQVSSLPSGLALCLEVVVTHDT